MDFIRFEEKQVSPWINDVEQFVEHVAVIIEGKSG
jgi:hypothetical protein